MLTARDLFEGLVGRRTGIIRDLALAETIDGDAPLVHAGVEIANAHPSLGGEHLRAGGAGLTRDDAIVSAICEGVERYAASSHPPHDHLGAIFGCRRSLGARALDPASFARFSDRQRALPSFPFARATDDTHLRWVEGVDLATGEPRLVPAFAVHLPYLPARGEPAIDGGISTGLACARSAPEAIARATREIIERDALALLFLRGEPPARVDAREVDAIARDLLPPRDRVSVFDVTTDVGVPVIFVLCVGEGPRGQLVSVGAACDPDPERALRKAAMEASQDRVYVRLLVEDDPAWKPHADFSNVVDFSRHARLYSADPVLARRGLFDWIDRGPTVTLARSRAKTLTFGGAAVDLTPPWAAALGLHVARVVVPELVPLHGNHLLRYEGHPRLGASPLWPYPHPMP
ncbi:MAG: YcaO-like family protein [Labilithrix sp.]|nr:YcaO-like family protein [Labilithrix sp.]